MCKPGHSVYIQHNAAVCEPPSFSLALFHSLHPCVDDDNSNIFIL